MNTARIDRMIAVLNAAKEKGVKVVHKIEADDEDTWDEIEDPLFDFAGLDYRVLRRKPGGKRRITAKDWEGQPVVWVKPGDGSECLVSRVAPWGFFITYLPVGAAEGRLIMEQWEAPKYTKSYSFDRKTWHPFEVEEGEGEWEVIASTEEDK
jgi:hypothetical protein